VLTPCFLPSQLDIRLFGAESNILPHEYSVHDTRALWKDAPKPQGLPHSCASFAQEWETTPIAQ
jgi:hypothetical protein